MSRLQDVILRGTRGAQPLATAVAAGTLYFVTDELVTERSSGTSWENYSPSLGGIVKPTGVTSVPYFIESEETVPEPSIIGGSGTSGITQLTGDITAGPGSGSQATIIANQAVTYAKVQNVSATSRVLARKTAGTGSVEECTLSDVLDFISSAAQGDILYRDASGWARLGAGTSGWFLKTQGAAANPIWAAASVSSSVNVVTVTITDAEMKAISSTPKTVLAAQGAGKIVWVSDMFFNANITTGGGTSVNLTPRYIGGIQNLASATSAVNNITTGIRNTYIVLTAINILSATDFANVGIEVIGSANAGGTYATTDGFHVTMFYAVVDGV
jgi:hypothetical protein